MRRTLGVCIVCGVCAGLLFFLGPGSAASQEKSKTGSAPQAVKTNTDRIELPSCVIRLPKHVRLASDRPGVIDFVEPEEGDRVNTDQSLAGLRDEVARANVAINKRLAEIKVDIRYAEKVHEYDTNQLERLLNANRDNPNIIPEIEVEEARLAKERSFLQIEKAEHDLVVNGLKLKEAEAELETYQIKAPFEGIVTTVLKRKGEAVRQGDVILELVNTDRVQVEGNVQIKDIFAVKKGARVVVRLNVPEIDLEVEQQEFEGRIGFVDVTVNPGSDTVRVWAEVENHDNILRGGAFATMIIFPGDVVELDKKAELEPRRIRQSSNVPRNRNNNK